MEDYVVVLVVGIICITLLVMTALVVLRTDSAILATGIAAISSLITWRATVARERKRRRD